MKSTSLYERRVKLAVEPHVQYGEPPRSRSIISLPRRWMMLQDPPLLGTTVSTGTKGM